MEYFKLADTVALDILESISIFSTQYAFWGLTNSLT